MLKTKVAGAQCDELATFRLSILMIRLATVNMPWRKGSKKETAKFRVWDKVPVESTFIFRDTSINAL